MGKKKSETKPRKLGVALQVVWKNPEDGHEYGLDACVCPEFGCIILGSIGEDRVQNHIAKAHREPSGILSEIGMQRMAAAGIPVMQGHTIAAPIRQGMIQ